MKLRGEIIVFIVLLTAGLIITPALGRTIQAGYQLKSQTKNVETLTVEFVDCTASTTVKKEVMMSKTEWNSITDELLVIYNSGISTKETLAAQLMVFQKYGLVSIEENIDTLLEKIHQRTNPEKIRSLEKRIQYAPLNNTLFSVLSAITFTLEDGKTVVLGLNSFINLIGFNIISFHKGYATEGIQTNGMMTSSVPPGEYVGCMFGFFGYWFGTKTSTGVYSNVTVAGLTFITLWLPIQSA